MQSKLIELFKELIHKMSSESVKRIFNTVNLAQLLNSSNVLVKVIILHTLLQSFLTHKIQIHRSKTLHHDYRNVYASLSIVPVGYVILPIPTITHMSLIHVISSMNKYTKNAE